MAGVYRPRHPERTVLYRVLFHYFDRFLAMYESRFEKEYGFFRPIVKEVVERYGVQCPQPGPGQDKKRGRAGGKIHDPAAPFPGAPLPG